MPIILDSNQNHAKAKDAEVVNALTASMGEGGGQIPMVVEPIVVRDEMTIKVDTNGKVFALRGRDHKSVQCVVTEDAESNRNT